MMEKIKQYWNTLSDECTVTKMDALLTVVVAALVGCIVGMLISPRKNKKIGCGNGCHRYFATLDGEEEADGDEWDED